MDENKRTGITQLSRRAQAARNHCHNLAMRNMLGKSPEKIEKQNREYDLARAELFEAETALESAIRENKSDNPRIQPRRQWGQKTTPDSGGLILTVRFLRMCYMGAESARKYNRDQAKSLALGIQRIIDRINRKYTPNWMISELNEANHKAQCIQHEFEREMGSYGDKI